MSNQKALNIILQSLAPYRVDENNVTLTQTILGRGAFGVVVFGKMERSVRSQESSTLVAVKQLQAIGTVAENKKLALALANELHVWAGLAHPNVLPLVGFLLDERMDKAWLISPYMKNGNIRSYLNEHIPDMIVRLRMWGEVARGASYLHRRNLCHGDIKAANILVDDDGQARICDFGLTKLMESGTTGSTTSTGQKGTIRFMPPDFFREERATRNNKSDVWAWGCLGLEILFDRIPYEDVKIDMAIMLRLLRGDLPLDVNAMVLDEDIRQLFKRCWVADPDDRIEMKACATGVERALERMQLAIEPDEPTSTADHVVVFPIVEIPGVLSTIRASSLDIANTHAVQLGSPYEAMQGSDFKMPSAPREPFSEDELSRNIDCDQLNPQGLPEWDHAPHVLAGSFFDKYRKNGRAADLDRAIELYHQALVLRPPGHPERDQTLHRLASSLVYKYCKDGEITQLDEAVNLYRQALSLRPQGHPEQDHTIHKLASSLVFKYSKNGEVADLEDAIDLYRQTLALRPQGHSKRDLTLSDLASSLVYKYRKHGNVADLDEVIGLYRQILLLRPQGHLERYKPLHRLAVSLRWKYQSQGDIADLDEAITLYQQELALLAVDGYKHSNITAELERLKVERLTVLRKRDSKWNILR